MKIGDYETHPAADAFPLMTGHAFKLFCEDVKKNELIDDIVVIGKLILDGRNRGRACEATGVTPRYREYTGDDPVGFIVSRNIARRHLNEGQRAIIASRLASLPRGRQKKSGRPAGLPQGEAAKQLEVGERTVRLAKFILDEASTAIVAAVDNGDLSLDAAGKLAKLPIAEQPAALKEVLKGETPKARGAAARDITAKNDNEDDVDAARVLLRMIAREVERMGGRIKSRDELHIVIILHGQQLELELQRKAA